MKKIQRIGIDGIGEDLHEQAESMKEVNGNNFWEAVLVEEPFRIRSI